MSEPEKLFCEDQQAFRNWLDAHHNQSSGIWMVFYKKHTGVAGISYQEALEEALCFGWIDSLVKRLDEERYMRKFTPRTNHNKWSEINLKTVENLIREGRMTEAGLKKIGNQHKSGESGHIPKTVRPPVSGLIVPEFILETLSDHEPALMNFLKLPSSCKREYVGWITQAKREETIRKRLIESVEMLKENKKLGLK
jgi:uncharacterized protein YdeI (YjbR/CyaY-like superfamily)